MGKMSRNKGKGGELEVRNLLRDHGFTEARRGQQYCGAAGDADVVGLPGYHIEVKRVEKFNLWPSLDQAVRDAREDEIPVVFHRPSRRKWIVVLDADDFLDLVERANNGCKD